MRFVRPIVGVLAACAVLFGATASGAQSPGRPDLSAQGAASGDGSTTGQITAAARYGWGEPIRRDGFTGTELDPSWGVYDSPGHNGHGVRSPDQVSVGDGIMRITGTPDGTTAGMSWRHPQMYGRWEIRARFPAGCGCYHPVLILWPHSGDWPAGGEIDYAEVFEADRQKLNFFLHYSADDKQITSSLPVDTTQWHNYAVEWTADHITGYVDGEPFFHTGRSDVQPPGPMEQTIQLDWFPDQDAGTGATLEVDWAAMYAP